MVLDGRVRELNKFCNAAADGAADFGRRRVGPAVIDARRNLSGVCGRWYPVIIDLHRFFIAAPDPMVWCAGALPRRRRLVHAVRDLAMLPGPPTIWTGDWVLCPIAVVYAEDVAHWPYTPALLVKWVAFFWILALACGWGGSWS